jgi:hypothetical protein
MLYNILRYCSNGSGIPVSLFPTNSTVYLPKVEDRTLDEMSLFSELIKDESIINSTIRVLRYERNQDISQEGLDHMTINILLEKMQEMKSVHDSTSC